MPATNLTRRDVLRTAAATATLSGLGTLPLIARSAHAGGSGPVRYAVIGCGGRGTGAAVNALDASPDSRIVALADVFKDRIESCRSNLANAGERAKVPDDKCFTGFDAYQKVLTSDVDVVILASPPGFRPTHIAAAIAAGKHVFTEKPVAVDAVGIRTVLAAAEQADAKKLCVVAGTQRRHQKRYLESIDRIRSGAIGNVLAARCYWNQGGLWMNDRQPDWSDMEWQMRNWLYFTWLSGDHICEQHVHNLDVCNWVIGAHPLRCIGQGGRQSRVQPAYGHVFDHFAVEYEYPGGVFVASQCRQIDGCASRVEEAFTGSEGSARTSPGACRIAGKADWQFKGDETDPYVQEHIDLIAAITSGKHINEARNVAESTLTAIMGRMSAYTGQELTWDQALNSTLSLVPANPQLGPIETPPVPMPGRTKFS